MATKQIETACEAKPAQAKRMSVCILLDPAHGIDTKGKCSPCGTLKEYAWSRMMCDKLKKKLYDNGYRVVKITESQNEIGLSNRVQIEHNYSNYFGRKKTVFISLHVNAAGSDGCWHNASGFQAHVCKGASANSKKLAALVYEELEAQGIKTRRPKKDQPFWENDFYVLKYTWAPATLLESGFMDNHTDCEFLLSQEGQEKILEAYYNAITRYVAYIVENQ